MHCLSGKLEVILTNRGLQLNRHSSRQGCLQHPYICRLHAGLPWIVKPFAGVIIVICLVIFMGQHCRLKMPFNHGTLINYFNTDIISILLFRQHCFVLLKLSSRTV